jgi:hypothetical protein
MKKTIDIREDIINRHPLTNKKRVSIELPERVNTTIPKLVSRKSPKKRFCHQRDPKILNKAL